MTQQHQIPGVPPEYIMNTRCTIQRVKNINYIKDKI